MLLSLHVSTALDELKEMEELAERCMADYDVDGWKHPAYMGPDDVWVLGKG